MVLYTYIWTEWIRISIIISLLLNEFSYGKAQIPHRFLNDILHMSYLAGIHVFKAFPAYTTTEL